MSTSRSYNRRQYSELTMTKADYEICKLNFADVTALKLCGYEVGKWQVFNSLAEEPITFRYRIRYQNTSNIAFFLGPGWKTYYAKDYTHFQALQNILGSHRVSNR